MKNCLVSSGGYKNSGPLTKEAQLELRWWLQTLHKVNGRAIKPNLPDMMIYTDASTWGWGARSGETTIGGACNNTEKTNCLELLGAWYATQALIQERENLTILLWIDKKSAVAYINHMGGTHSSQLANLTIQLWSWALKKGIFLMAKHIAGKDNVSADWMSRAH